MFKRLIILLFILFLAVPVNGAVLYEFPLDEASWSGGTNVINEIINLTTTGDAVNGCNTVVFSPTPTLTTRAGDFDGTNDYADLESIDGVSFDTTGSMSCWIQFDVWDSYDSVFGKTPFSNNNIIMLMRNEGVGDGNALNFYLGDSSGNMNSTTTEGNFTPSMDVPYFFEATWTTHSIKIYINGVEKGTSSPATDRWPANWTNFCVGGTYSIYFLNGKVYDLQIHDTTHTPAEALTLYESYNKARVTATMNGYVEPKLTEGLVAEYQMGTSGWANPNDVIDSSVNTFHADPYGGIDTQLRAIPTQIVDREAVLNGSSQYILSPDLDAQTFPTSGTISCRFNATDVGDYECPWSNNGLTFTNNNALRVYFNTDDTLIFYIADSAGNANQIQTTATIAASKEYLLVVTWAANSLKMYLDGELVATGSPGTNRVPSNWDDFCIGRSIANYYFNGTVSHVRIWNKVLNDAERNWIEFSDGVMREHITTTANGYVKQYTKSFSNFGDSQAYGAYCGTPSSPPGDTITTYLQTASGATWTGVNRGVNGDTTALVADRIAAQLATDGSQRVPLTTGSNDYYYEYQGPGYEVDTYAELTTILGIVQAGADTLIVGEVMPITDRTEWEPELAQKRTKIIAAIQRKWCVDNQQLFTPTYDLLAYNNVTYEDDISESPTDFDADKLHLTCAGLEAVANSHWNNRAIPSRMYRWGTAVYGVNDISWKWWVLSGTAAITGDADTGTLSLANGDSAVCNVKAIEVQVYGTHLSKTLTITPTVASGTVNTYYRSSNENFDRDNSTVSWRLYTAPCTIVKDFVQIKLEATGGAATVSDVKYEWTAGETIVSNSGAVMMF